MYERYSENARRVIFLATHEARAAGAAYIEPEHLLLGIVRCGDRRLERILKLTNLEGALRAELLAKPHPTSSSKNADVPLSNQSIRVLRYGMEEADKQNSPGIGPEHLLLGVLRDPDGIASRFLLAHGVDLNATRRSIGSLPPAGEPATASAFRAQVASLRARTRRARYWVSAVQLGILALLGFVMVSMPISGNHLLWIGIAWLLAVCAWIAAWHLVEPSGMWGFKFSARHGTLAMFLIYSKASLYQLFLFGWLIPVALGIYRITRG